MKYANAPFNEFGQSMILRDIEDLYIRCDGLDTTDEAIESAINSLAVVVSGISSVISGLGTMSVQNANAVAITGGSITGITDLAVADGGTGSSTPAGARTNLGLGTIAVLDSPLPVANGGTALTTVAQDRIVYTSALDTFSATTITSFGRLFIACADAAAGRTQLSLGTMATINSPVPVANGGTAKTGIAADKFWYASSTDTLAETSITSFGRLLVACVDAAAGRTQLGLGTFAVLSSLAYSALSDVTVAAIADLDFARYDAGTSKWKNVNMGRMTWTAGSSEFALDGGSGASASSVVGIGKTGSRFMLGGTVTALDFYLSGSVVGGTDVSARIRARTSSAVSFYDQGGPTYTTGTMVMEWGLDGSSYASRYFRAMIPLQVLDNSGGGGTNLSLRSVASQLWDITDDAAGVTKYLTFVGPSGDAASIRRTLLAQPLDLAGKTIYADKAGGSSATLVYNGTAFALNTSVGAVTITASGSASTFEVGAGSFTFTHGGGTPAVTIGSNVKIGTAAGSLGFYNSAGLGIQTVTGSRGGNAALASLLTKLASLGLLIDGSTV